MFCDTYVCSIYIYFNVQGLQLMQNIYKNNINIHFTVCGFVLFSHGDNQMTQVAQNFLRRNENEFLRCFIGLKFNNYSI